MADSRNIFTGFSTAGSTVSKQWTFYDIDLIKRDLMNHFHTRVGERVGRPTWGCKIWDYLMEPLTPGMRDLVASEAIRICESDSRVVVQDVKIVALGNGVRVELTLLYSPMNVADSFYVDFEARQAE